MSTPAPIDVVVNPLNNAQRYILWSNGRVDAVGGAPPITSGPAWYDQTQMPWGVALWIINWTNGQGYVLDAWGYHAPLNGATAISTSIGGSLVNWNNSNGLPYTWPTRTYTDWTWDSAGASMGYALTMRGALVPFGGTVPPPRTGDAFGWDAARKIQASWSGGAVSKAVWMDMFGRCHAEFGATLPATGPFWPGWDAARDFTVTDWTTGSGYILDLYGGVNPFGPTAITASGGPFQPGADNGRCMAILSASNPLKIWQVWANGQQFEYNVSTPPTVTAGGGVNEVQTVTITGSPTAGTFTLTYSGQTTAAIAYNALASAVQTALRALSNIGSTGVTVTGGPGPGTPYTVTFAGSLAFTNVTQMTASSSFTGGTSPSTTVTTTVDGVTASPANTVTTTTRPVLSWTYSDAEKDKQAAYEVYLFTGTFASTHPAVLSDPASFASNALVFGTDTSPIARGVIADMDLTNGSYTYVVRAKDTSGLWSSWDNRTWTQAVSAPPSPSGLSVIPDQVNYRIGLTVTCVAASATYVRFEYSDDLGAHWYPVVGADAVALAATTTATDYAPPLGVSRTYRAWSYSLSPRVASDPSSTAAGMITRQTHVLTATSNPALGGEIRVIEKPTWTRPVKAGVFEGIGAKFPTVVSDGVPKARKMSLKVECNSRKDWDLIDNLISANSNLILRDPFGDVTYCRVVGDWSREQQRRGPSPSETTSLAHAHHTVIPLVEIAPPVTSALAGFLPPGLGT